MNIRTSPHSETPAATPAQGPVSTWPPVPEFWSSRFPAETRGATSPVLFKGIVPAENLGPDDVLAGVRRLQGAASSAEPTSARTRVYIGEQRRDDIIDTVLSTPWEEGTDFLPWMQNVCGAERFSLVVNNLETTSPKLSAVLGTLIQSAFAGWGMPIGGCEQVSFLGNYSATAFGVHEGDEDAFLVHLGPGVKHFYCWSRELYTSLTGGTDPTFGESDWLLEHGECFDLEAGDVLFLPRKVFHVGRQTEFSVSVAVPVYTYPDSRLLAKEILPALLETLAVPGDAIPSPMHNVVTGPDPIAEDLIDAAGIMLDQATAAVPTHVRAVLHRRWRTVLSNGGWEWVEYDLARADAARAAANALAAGADSITVPEPYTMFVDEDLDEDLTVAVTVRGTTLRIPESHDWGQVLRELAAGLRARIPDSLRESPEFADLIATGGVRLTRSEG